ncbi:hypothetical protein C7999DRAFT_39638 [Corynascus novoguineensis]|uniref:Uncharacterized protein n=1 Tax=Corynascus novoguineensis TaxID=1126955 RepID=A0AAN7CY11_9PEZI|nr:hypothetical protein C7999DRAFT_39638 [Corynascus novoguineensis]
MAIYSGVRRFYTSLQRMVGLRRRKRQLQIVRAHLRSSRGRIALTSSSQSEPFNFRKEATVLPGLSEEEMSAFREKAAVSRLGIAHTHAGAYNDTSTSQHCCRSPQSPPSHLSIPLPIPVSGAPPVSRHGTGSSSMRSRSTTTTGAAPVLPGAKRVSMSMNDLSDLLLFGNTSSAGF